MSDELHIELLSGDELYKALSLAKRVFLQYDAPDYSEEGVKGVVCFIEEQAPQQVIDGTLEIYGCYLNGELAGMCAIKLPDHISLLFVDGQYHHRSVATSLINKLVLHAKLHNISELTVHSSPYAIGFYHKMGFCDTDTQTVRDNIIFTPMRLKVLDNR